MRWKPYEERFWEKTNRPSNEECWEWEGVLANFRDGTNNRL